MGSQQIGHWVIDDDHDDAAAADDDDDHVDDVSCVVL
jgi:hypothetical protein